MTGAWTQPRRPPDAMLPAIAGTAVVFLAAPLFLLQDWPIKGWALGAFLWLASVAFGLLLHRLHSRTDNLAAAGVTAFGMMFRAIAVMVVVFVAAVSDPWVGLAAALVYAVGYSAELGLSLVTYYTGPAAGRAAE
ncbi:MAG: hypothetical protein ACJ744_07900 [Gaiellaceae bacterium]|jgi:hypothetical protein